MKASNGACFRHLVVLTRVCAGRTKVSVFSARASCVLRACLCVLVRACACIVRASRVSTFAVSNKSAFVLRRSPRVLRVFSACSPHALRVFSMCMLVVRVLWACPLCVSFGRPLWAAWAAWADGCFSRVASHLHAGSALKLGIEIMAATVPGCGTDAKGRRAGHGPQGSRFYKIVCMGAPLETDTRCTERGGARH